MKIFNLFNKLFKKSEPKIKFGWKRDLPDIRDFRFKIELPHVIPPMVDLRESCPSIYNQGSLGSCTANALAGAFQFEQMKQQDDDVFIPSRLFIYYNERVIEDSVNEDSGAMIRDGIKTMVKEGVCPESLWPYVPSKFSHKPCNNCYKIALDNQVQEYLRITPHSLYEVKHCISDGYPVIFGFTVFESFMTEEVARTGIAPIPGIDESTLGGHAVLAVGYDDSKNALIVRNSWGPEWGLNGYFYLPYEYVTTPDMSADYWTIRLVE
jgi:C1A family cysteine protease